MMNWIVDLDGVLSDGKFWQTPSGTKEKKISVRDRIAAKTLTDIGHRIFLVSSRPCDSRTELQLKSWPFQEIAFSVDNRLSYVREKLGLDLDSVVWVTASEGDGVIAEQVSTFCVVRGAAEDLQSKADFVSQRESGEGVLQEFATRVLNRSVAERKPA